MRHKQKTEVESEGSWMWGNSSVSGTIPRKAHVKSLLCQHRGLKEKLKLTVNREKSRTVSVFAIRNFKFLGFALGRNGSGIYVRVHPKSWKKFKSKLKDLSSRKSVQSIKPSLEKIKVYARGRRLVTASYSI